jgi:gamma-glutamyltranspeptidase/glutathione hydrolase
MAEDCRSSFRSALLLAVLAVCCHTTTPPAPAPPPRPKAKAQPQRALPDVLWTGEARSPRGMVVCGSREAAEAGARMLEQGGNAVDAAVAAALALGVASPGSCGLGGQTYILLHLSDGRDLAIDGSCRAPATARPEVMQSLRNHLSSYYGYKSVATPGTLAALALALDRYGTRTLAETLAPAIEIAEYGSVWTPALRSFLDVYYYALLDSRTLSTLFLKDGITPWDIRHVYCNPDLACFLRRLAQVGADDFYRGRIAAEIDADMKANGGWLRGSDLALLRAEIREPVRGRYRGLDVLSFPLPARGAGVVEALAILDRFPQELLRADSADRLHLLIEACRLAHADSTPLRRPPRLPDDLAMDPAYVASRAALIRLDRALLMQQVSPTPLSMLSIGGTTQISVADAAGNLVAMTQTLGNTFGGLVATEGFGFAYNNLVFGFDYQDARRWRFLKPYQKPLTGIAPTILLKDGRPYLAIGSAGSDRILAVVINVVSNLVDRGLPLCEAVTAARAVWSGFPDDTVYLEMVDPITDAQADTLKERGFTRQKRQTYPATPIELTEFGGANALLVDPADGALVGVGDPRRQGVAVAPRDGPPDPAEAHVVPECWRTVYGPTPAPRIERARQAPSR